MTLQVAEDVSNAMLDAFEASVGVSPVLKMRTGAPPATCATADSGTVLCSITCPSDWLAAAASRSKAKTGTWSGTGSGGGGTVAHWRLYASDGTTCKAQGTITITGGGGDMTVDNTVVADGQAVVITSWTITDVNG